MFNIKEHTVEKVFRHILWGIIALGITLRFIVYLQNRDLIIDEANIARNLFEKNYLELMLPLKYEQYAPPIFLWIEKLSTQLFGFGEFALKLYPLITGIVALFFMRAILLRIMPATAAWLPLLLMATTYWYILYSTTVKQYMPDAMISLILVWFALKYDISAIARAKFIRLWTVVGILAIWSSMPSIFVLLGVGVYYLFQYWRQKDAKMLQSIMIVGSICVLNFAVYYFLILRAEAGSNHLQAYHANYFLIATPANAHEWHHNWARIREIISNLGGHHYHGYLLTLLLLAISLVTLFIMRKDLLLLFLVPVALTLMAAALRQFSLIDRVILFMMPLLLLVLGYGFAQIMQVRVAAIKLIGLGIGAVIIYHYGEYKFFKEELPSPEIGKALDFVQTSGASPSEIYIHHATTPVYIYYTEVAPRKAAWKSLQGAHLLQWDSNYDTVLHKKAGKAYFIYTGGISDKEIAAYNGKLTQCAPLLSEFHGFTSRVMVYSTSTCK